MGMQVTGQVGPQVLGDGVGTQPFRQEKTGAIVMQHLHGRFYESNCRGAVYSGGMTPAAINNSTYTTGTLTASCTPIIGVWNPSTNTVNLVILQATLSIVVTAATATGCGGFV